MIDEIPSSEALDELPEPPTQPSVPAPDPADDIARSLPVTQWAVDVLTPYEWMRLADYLTGLLTRAPLKEGAGYWAGVRIVLGALASELRQNALDAGEPAETSEDLTPEWLAWDQRMQTEYNRATDALLHRRPMTFDRPTAAPVVGSA